MLGKETLGPSAPAQWLTLATGSGGRVSPKSRGGGHPEKEHAESGGPSADAWPRTRWIPCRRRVTSAAAGREARGPRLAREERAADGARWGVVSAPGLGLSPSAAFKPWSRDLRSQSSRDTEGTVCRSVEGRCGVPAARSGLGSVGCDAAVSRGWGVPAPRTFRCCECGRPTGDLGTARAAVPARHAAEARLRVLSLVLIKTWLSGTFRTRPPA